MSVLINGLVAVRDKQPYIQIDVDGHLVQLTMSQARQIARDIEVIAARTEADAMIVQFFNEVRFPEAAAGELLVRFRDFRQKLDDNRPERAN